MSAYLPPALGTTDPVGSGRISLDAELVVVRLAYSGHLVPPATVLASADRAHALADRARATSEQFRGVWTQIWG